MRIGLSLPVWGGALALAAGLAVATPATAQDWTGWYIGKHFGYATGNRVGCTSYDFFGPTPTNCDEGNGSFDIDTDYAGWLVGKQIGYNYQSDSIVYGVEIAGSWLKLDSVDQFDGVNGINALFTGTARVGVDAGGVLFYGEAGLGVANFEYGPNAAGCAFSSTLTGVVIGAGIEAMMGPNASVFAEVNGIGFAPSTATCPYSATPPTVNPASYSETQTKVLVFKVGFNWLM